MRPVDMEAIGADFYVCSPYKFLGPHIGMLAASPALLETMHPDKLRPSTEQVPERFELGTLPYELLAGVTAAIDVLADLVPGDEGTMSRRERLVRSMTVLEEYEDDLHERMRSGLESIDGVHCHGHAPVRTPTELFSVDGVPAADVYRALPPVASMRPPGRSTRSRRPSGLAWERRAPCVRGWRRTRTPTTWTDCWPEWRRSPPAEPRNELNRFPAQFCRSAPVPAPFCRLEPGSGSTLAGNSAAQAACSRWAHASGTCPVRMPRRAIGSL